MLVMDETTDVSSNRADYYCLSMVTEHLEVHKDFLGLYNVPSINAVTLATVPMNALVKMNLSTSKLHGQC